MYLFLLFYKTELKSKKVLSYVDIKFDHLIRNSDNKTENRLFADFSGHDIMLKKLPLREFKQWRVVEKYEK